MNDYNASKKRKRESPRVADKYGVVAAEKGAQCEVQNNHNPKKSKLSEEHHPFSPSNKVSSSPDAREKPMDRYQANKSNSSPHDLPSAEQPDNPLVDLPHDWDEGDLDAEFCIESFQEEDYWFIKNMLKSYLMDTSYNSSELADLMLIAKDNIGSAITVVGQEETFGFMSIINFSENYEKSCIQSILKFVLNRTSTSSQSDEWKRILGKKDFKIGLILSERIANLPDHLAPHLNLITLKELSQLNPAPSYDYFLLITNTYKQVEPAEGGDEHAGSSSTKNFRAGISIGKASKHALAIDSSTTHFFKVEDEIFKECSYLSHSSRFIRNNSASRWTMHMFAQQSKLFLLISKEQLPRIIQKLTEFAKVVQDDVESKQRSSKKSRR